MCAGSELKDTQGETLSVDGANIDELEQGRGRFNDNHGKGFFNSLGRVTEAKKIYKSEDCDNERHSYYWEKIKAPFVYAKGYLYNDDDHPNARAAAAILRNIHREDTPLKMKASVEGGVLSRGIKDPTRLARTKIHSVALTFTPANNATLVEPLSVDKSNTDWDADKQLIKSVMHLAETNVPSFRHIERHASANTIYENINKIQELAKSVGIELMIKEDIDPDTIMQKAVLNKISTNVSKINHLIKGAKDLVNMMKPAAADTATAAKPASTPTTTSPGKVAMAAEDKKQAQLTSQDKYQQGVGKMKMDATTPQKPKDITDTPDNTMKVKNAKQVKHTNTLKGHASKAMKDPSHLGMVQQSLIDKGIPAKKVRAILTRIRSHMQEPVAKSEEVEKGDLGRAAKNLVLAGAMGMGVHHMGQDKDAKKEAVKQVKPKQQIERNVASKPKKKGEYTDEEIADIKKKGAEARKWLRQNTKTKLKKALTAGYGGAGAPTNLTGGGVIQAESIDDGRTKKADDGEFKYVNCDNCGHEQVYMGHQVKCRKCRQNFNLNKLKDLM